MEDRYEIGEKIGQGGIGSVHRAYDQKMGRHVAIKRILTSGEGSSQETEATKQMVSEVSALSSLQHPHIVTVFDVGEDEQGPFVVMELINGKTLDEITENAPLTWKDFNQVAMQSLEALIAAHDLEMIHSDLKPPNIMLSWMPSGAFQVKIVDFGLATMIHNQSQEEIRKMDAVYGSVFFMPPEQFEGKVLDVRSDLYSIGCCFYQALAGHSPFNGDTGLEVMQAHLEHLVVPIREIRDDIPEWACNWVMWMINRNPDDRPPSSREALAEFLRNAKKTDAVSGQGAASKSKPRLITSNAPPKGETASISAAQETSAVHVVAAPGGGHSAGHAGSPMTAAVHLGAATQGKPKPIAGKLLKIAIPAAAVLVLALTVSMAMKRNQGIRLKNAYQNIIAMATAQNVTQIHLNDAQVRLVFDVIADAKPGDNLAPAYEALTKANSTGDTDIDNTILEFATLTNLPGETRRGLFEEVIGSRRNAEAMPGVIKFIKGAEDMDDAAAAFDAILPLIGEEHAEGMLGIIALSDHPQIRAAAKSKMSDIIARSHRRDDLAGLITKAGKETSAPGIREQFDRLLAQCKPRNQPQASTPGRRQSSPQPTPQGNRDPEEVTAILESFEAADDAGRPGIIATLGRSPDELSHQALMRIAQSDDYTHLRAETIQALIELNTQPERTKATHTDGGLSDRGMRQRWLRILWRCEDDEQRIMVIDALAGFRTDWATDIIEERSRRRGDPTTHHAQRILQKLEEDTQ